MTNEKILKEALKKAVVGGYSDIPLVAPLLQEDNDEALFMWANDDIYFTIIFTHNFAKAFWGEEQLEFYVDGVVELGEKENDKYYCFPIYRWQYHLQQMVLEEKPLEYLEKFI